MKHILPCGQVRISVQRAQPGPGSLYQDLCSVCLRDRDKDGDRDRLLPALCV